MSHRGRFSDTVPWSKRGRALPPMGRSLPRISDQFTDIAIYLYHTREDAEAGSDIGGSGFLVGLPLDSDPSRSWVIAVTNKHNIEHGALFVRVNNKLGSASVFEIPKSDWLFHPDGQDLAIGPMRVNDEFHRYKFIHFDAILTKDKIATMDIGIGTDTFLVGRFVGRDGGQTNTPTVRFGNIAQMPTMITNQFGEEQESFLIETRSIGGFSGSPVFAYRQPFEANPDTKQPHLEHWGPLLLGVNWGHAGSVDCVFNLHGDELDMYVEGNTGLAFATPAWRLLELLNSKEFRSRLPGTPTVVGDVDLNLPPELRLWGET